MDFAKRTHEHYAAHGKNASYVVRGRYQVPGSLGVGMTTKTVTATFRKGREDEGEAVQMHIDVRTDYNSGKSREDFAGFSFDAATWAAIVAFVQENHELPMLGVAERRAQEGKP